MRDDRASRTKRTREETARSTKPIRLIKFTIERRYMYMYTADDCNLVGSCDLECDDKISARVIAIKSFSVFCLYFNGFANHSSGRQE